jgi:hypothetical protein
LHPADGYRQSLSKVEVSSALQPAVEAFSLSGANPQWFKVTTSPNSQGVTNWLNLVLELKENHSNEPGY